MRLKAIANNVVFTINSWFVKRPRELFRSIRQKELYQYKSYFPENIQKSSRKIFWEQVTKQKRSNVLCSHKCNLISSL